MAIKELNIRNKRARFEFHLDEVFEAGIVLTGTEIKSIRNGKASILEAYGLFDKGEVWLRNMHITEYENGSFYNHKPRADRKLLLQRKEIVRIEKFLKIKGHTLVPLKLFLSDKNILIGTSVCPLIFKNFSMRMISLRCKSNLRSARGLWL
jgi:SsrA-binding protein